MLRLVALVLALSAGTALADAPKFSDYPAEIYTGKVAKPVLDTADKRMFRTRIDEAAKGKPDFAGSFIFARWGCGASCVSGAVIDARTGAVTMVPWMVCCSANYDVEPLVYRADSRLVVFNGLIDEEEPDAAHYFEWDGKEFRAVATEKFK
jgi:hypothetical protein